MRSRWPNLTEDRVIDLTRRWADREHVGVLIVFDGTTGGFGAGVSKLDERTSVVGTGRGIADDWIAEQAERLASVGARVWLASSDRGLRQRVIPFVERMIGGGSIVEQLVALEQEPHQSRNA